MSDCDYIGGRYSHIIARYTFKDSHYDVQLVMNILHIPFSKYSTKKKQRWTPYI